MNAPASDVYAVIMAGGSGTRFWPWSRAARPKQLLPIAGGEATMIQATVSRLQPLIPAERVLVVTTAALAEATARQLPAIPRAQIIAEPVGRDTTACVALAALIAERLHPGAVLVMLPADQVISPADSFQTALAAGIAEARAGHIATFGIAPTSPATGYGYIRVGDGLPGRDGCAVNLVERFVEKPDAATAAAYLADGGYRWNSGIFVWSATTVLAGLRAHAADIVGALAPVQAAWGTPGFASALAAIYPGLRRISIDYALLEKPSALASSPAPSAGTIWAAGTASTATWPATPTACAAAARCWAWTATTAC